LNRKGAKNAKEERARLLKKYQGDDLRYRNGSLIEKDSAGLGKEIGTVLVNALIKMGATFISYTSSRTAKRNFTSRWALNPIPATLCISWRCARMSLGGAQKHF
jgi:hypothetical protein